MAVLFAFMRGPELVRTITAARAQRRSPFLILDARQTRMATLKFLKKKMPTVTTAKSCRRVALQSAGAVPLRWF